MTGLLATITRKADKRPCVDYDPDYKLHGCELDEHTPSQPHRDITGREWFEHVTIDPSRCVSFPEGCTGWLDQTCSLGTGHPGMPHRDRCGNEWASDTEQALISKGRLTVTEATYLHLGDFTDGQTVVTGGRGGRRTGTVTAPLRCAGSKMHRASLTININGIDTVISVMDVLTGDRWIAPVLPAGQHASPAAWWPEPPDKRKIETCSPSTRATDS